MGVVPYLKCVEGTGFPPKPQANVADVKPDGGGAEHIFRNLWKKGTFYPVVLVKGFRNLVSRSKYMCEARMLKVWWFS